METIRNIIQGYHTINKSRKTTHWYTNVYESIQHYLTIIDYVEKQIEPLEKALTTYIESKPNIVKEWIKYGLTHMMRYMNMNITMKITIKEWNCILPDMKERWPLFFQESFEGYEISFEKTLKVIENIRTKSNIQLCDDPDILAIHTNKKCNCMYMCSLCEEMEEQWSKKVRQKYSSPTNIFLHKEHQAAFLEKWIQQHPTYSEFQWPPQRIYFQDYVMNDYKRITDFAEMCSYMKEKRKKYKQGGKTPIQCHDELCYDIQGLFNYINTTDSDMTIFMKLWNQIEIVPIWIRYEKERCKEILKML
jgi:hypothetical protein